MSDRTGVIHDIGYRHYDGPRLGRWAITQALMVSSLRHAYGIGRSGKSKVMPIFLLAVMVVPAAIVVGIENGLQFDKPPIEPVDYIYLLQPVIALYLASQAPQLFSRDLRYRSIVLYLARPPRRTDYALAKLTALVAAQMILICIPLVVLYAGALLAKYNFLQMSKQFVAGLAGALLLSILLAAIGGLIAAATPRRGFAVAAIIAVLIVSFTAATTTMAIVDEKGDMSSTAARYASLVSPFNLTEALQTWFLRNDRDGSWMPTTQQGLVFTAVYVLLVAACVWGVNARYAKVARG
ncbi:ABC-2 type transport system permease protein [Kribbella orskensis]|uniref:ABC-2 type transport system permease protein n=1 Tax=Kribbella orskensis TaxID=2512216 RepID=A0ABY2BDG2_9ACTN|nr:MULTISPECIES: ABC transporter permease [Kribbella]TCN34622.1 ABC-2 type transport system permease protein [Kribbella sp. VKM Ac-2500]TCO14947.1 ABC-2 type transport system permease protein [Kribbella orskensis]